MVAWGPRSSWRPQCDGDGAPYGTSWLLGARTLPGFQETLETSVLPSSGIEDQAGWHDVAIFSGCLEILLSIRLLRQPPEVPPVPRSAAPRGSQQVGGSSSAYPEGAEISS